jgi:transposase
LGQKIKGMRNVFGGLDVMEGRALIGSYERKASPEFCSFLRDLKERYYGYGLWLVLDNAPVHKSKLSLQTMAKLGLHPFWLPKASPELNPQELVWKLMQSRYINNRDFREVVEIDEMVRDFEDDFNQRRITLDLSSYNGQLWS